MTAAAPFRTKRACCYLRVSSADQNPSLQADETQDLVKRRGWHLTTTYSDHGMSGTREKRPDLDRMLAAARRREFDVIVVYRSDRLFRSLKNMVNVLDELAALGVDFVSTTEVFDTTTPGGRLLIHLVAAFGEFERGVLVERVRAGLAAARRRGVKVGRPRVDIDVARAVELRRSGKTLRQVAHALGAGVTTVHRALRAREAGVSKTPVKPVTQVAAMLEAA